MLHKSIRILLSFIPLMTFLPSATASSSTMISRSKTGSFTLPTKELAIPEGPPLFLQHRPAGDAAVRLTGGQPGSTIRLPKAVAAANGPSRALSPSAAGGAAFVMEVHPNKYMHYIPNIDSPGDWIYVSSLTGAAYFAGDFVGNDFSQLYVLEYNLNELHSLDTSSGVPTTIGACIPDPGQVWTGATGSVDGILYASSTGGSISYLYTIDLATGTAHVIGEITNAPSIIDIAINAEGELYGVETTNDNLVQIDPASGAGTVIGPLGFNADYAQSMDFEQTSGVLYLAAYNVGSSQGELRIADTATGSSVLVDKFTDGAEVGVLAFTPRPAQVLQNPGFESDWDYWQNESYPALSSTSHSGSQSIRLDGEECWAWQQVHIPVDATDVTVSYWVTGISADPDPDNDILCGGIWDPSRQVQYADVCYGLFYFYNYPMVWRMRLYRLKADELAAMAGKDVLLGFQLTQDWVPGYSNTSTAWVDDASLYITRPIYDNYTYLPLLVR